MKKTIIAWSFILSAMILAPHSGNTMVTLHWQANTIHCLDCHSTHFGAKTDCAVCHDTGGGYSNNSGAPAEMTHAGMDCAVCHNPHTSGQCATPLVEGTFSGYELNPETTTFSISFHIVNDPAWETPATWSEKSGPERGLIFLVEKGLWDASRSTPVFVDYSAEVVHADANTITVNGVHAGSDLTGSFSFKLLYGQLVKTGIAGKAVVFNGPATFAVNDGLNGGNDSTPDGVCQVCHTQTKYWRSNGTLAEHNSGGDCTECHPHSEGFRPNCNLCHGSPPTAGIARPDDGLVAIPSDTGSTTAGAHGLHAGGTGYNYSCDICHYNGMPATPISGNNKIQIGFKVFGFDGAGTSYDGQVLKPPFSYEGTNGTLVTTGATPTRQCSNTYCHSSGSAVATGAVAANTSPAWNAKSTACDACHSYPPSYPQDEPKANNHVRHVIGIGYTCDICHYGTTTDGASITNKNNHANGGYDVQPAPTFTAHGVARPLNFTYTFGPGGGTCSSNTCHQYWDFLETAAWGGFTLQPRASWKSGGNCYEVEFQAAAPVCTPSYPGCTEPYTYVWDFGDGQTGQGSPVAHTYAAAGNYTATLTQSDALRHTGTWTATVTALANAFTAPVVEQQIAQEELTVTVTDLSHDLDYQSCGNSGAGRIIILWGDGQRTDAALNLTDTPSNTVFTHTYGLSGTYYIKTYVWDNSGLRVIAPTVKMVVP